MASLVVLANGGSVLIGLIIVAVPYFAPSIVAFVRHHHNQWAIFALNLLLGWTGLGWIGALVWSLTRPTPQPSVVHVYHDQTEPPAEPPAEA
jgi:ABC-type transport system involved in cytochrome c biogenesis permease component